MVAIVQRGLFWRVYLTLLASLLLVVVLAATLWHSVAEQPMPGAMSYPSATLGALLPGTDAPKAEIDQILRRISGAVGGRVMLVDSQGRTIGVAQHGQTLAVSNQAQTNAAHHVAMLRLWRVHLADGRSLVVEESSRFGGGPHILGMLMAIAAAVGLAAYPVVARLTRRLETLRESLDGWGGGRLDSRAEVEGQDEIAAVAASFNAAADRVETLLAAHRALLAHASHELRSPLTRLRLAVEVFADTPDPALRSSIIADIAELDSLVDEILLASRLDHAPGLPEHEVVDCLGLAAEEAARAGAGVRHVAGAPSFEVLGSPRLLRRMIRNLLENAGKHGQPPVEVELSHGDDASGRWITIAVRDHGPGIPDAERERVFEPFYRPSGRAETAGSWGLGLSIVSQIAERHGGDVSCQTGPDGGGCFIVRLPAAPSKSAGAA